jgi:hypothetical protein
VRSLGRLWLDPPLPIPEYYWRLAISPQVRKHRDLLPGFGEHWMRVKRILPIQHMTRSEFLLVKLSMLETWILTHHARRLP